MYYSFYVLICHGLTGKGSGIIKIPLFSDFFSSQINNVMHRVLIYIAIVYVPSVIL